MKKAIQGLLMLIFTYVFIRLGIIIGLMIRFYTDSRLNQAVTLGQPADIWMFISKLTLNPWVLYGFWSGAGLTVGWWVVRKIKFL